MADALKAVNTIINYVTSTINEKTKNLSYDKSIKAKITKSLGNNKYEVEHGGRPCSTFSLNKINYSVGDYVLVMFMQNAINEGVIIGKLS